MKFPLPNWMPQIFKLLKVHCMPKRLLPLLPQFPIQTPLDFSLFNFAPMPNHVIHKYSKF